MYCLVYAIVYFYIKHLYEIIWRNYSLVLFLKITSLSVSPELILAYYQVGIGFNNNMQIVKSLFQNLINYRYIFSNFKWETINKKINFSFPIKILMGYIIYMLISSMVKFNPLLIKFLTMFSKIFSAIWNIC